MSVILSAARNKLRTKVPSARGLHSSTLWLNLGTFCGIRWVHHFPPV
jgi:hypothetical protein